MPLNKEKLGNLITQIDKRNKNTQLGIDCVRGISVKKVFTATKADLYGVSLNNYKIVPPQTFAYVADTSRRGDKIAIAFNDSKDEYLISSIYTTFAIKSQNLLPEYLGLFFNRTEFDRLARFNSWGSARETFDWEDFCELEIEVPPLAVQQKYVSIYHAILNELKVNIQTSTQMQRVCSSFVENALQSSHKMPISAFIEEIDRRNSDDEFTLDNLKGITTRKEFISTKADMNGVSLSNYKVVQPKEFAYVADTSRRGDKISLAFNEGQGTILVSSITTVFRVKGDCQNTILPEYMYLFLRRNEFDRYARYNSWGSAREAISWDDFGRYQIPVVSLKQQQSIINLFHAQRQQDLSAQKLTEIQNRISPILIAGALKEGAKS